MSVNYPRAYLNKAQTRGEYKKLSKWWYWPDYWDEGITFYPKRNRGTHHPWPKLYSYQIRMYRTWKHNRKTQWKEK